MESQQPSFRAAVLVTYSAALLAFVLRLLARRRMGLPLSVDDYLAVAAFIFTTCFTVVNLYKLHFGLGLHLADIGVTYEKASYDYFRLLWIDSWFYTSSIGFSKLAVLCFYFRIFGRSSIRRPIQITFAFVLMWLLVRVIIIPIQCIPIKKYWDRKVDGICPVKSNIFFFATTFPHLFMEIAIVVMPIIKVQQLVMPRAQKIAVCCMFASGSLVCVVAIVQLILAFYLDMSTREIMWTGSSQLMCSCMEVNLGHFASSLPNLRPILDMVIGRRSLKLHGSSIPVFPHNCEQRPIEFDPLTETSFSKDDVYSKVRG